MTEQVQNQEVQQAQVQLHTTLLKLVTGQYLISDVAVRAAPDGTELITLVNPCEIVENLLEDGRTNVEFAPIATLSASGTFEVAGTAIVYTAAPEAGFANVYRQRFAPKDDTPQLIVPPEKKLVVPN